MNRPRFYARLASQNIRNNRKFYIPYMLTGMGCTLMLYMLSFLWGNEGLNGSFGGRTLVGFLGFGLYIVVIFSVVVLFYTNGFLMKRRKNELGLFMILGMEKRHLGGVQLCESLIVAVTAVLGGLVLGVGFSGLTLRLLTKISHLSTPLIFSVDTQALLLTAGVFAAIYLVIFLYNLSVVGRARPIELLKGTAAGEREPKARKILAALGVLALGGGYAIAVLVKNPMTAILLFFVAVVLVIAGTYLLFTAGSISLLKGLRKNKAYYYKTSHFINVSGMIYRMKQNAVGLANICILATMVLVMISSTVTLNAGARDMIYSEFPGEIVIDFHQAQDTVRNEGPNLIREYAASRGVEISEVGSVEQDGMYQLYFDAPDLDGEAESEFTGALFGYLTENIGEPYFDEDGNLINRGFYAAFFRLRSMEIEDVYSMYGGLLFLGITLGLMFIMAAILIIYYKQVTEGYNDKERFVIMRKVGLSSQEIKSSIRSQILSVFFLPLIAAVVHLSFAFNIITKLLSALRMTNIGLFALCTAGTVAVFAALYYAVYAGTAREYYKIVSAKN
jgi:hypothetical protein